MNFSVCPRCSFRNQMEARFCSGCAMRLNPAHPPRVTVRIPITSQAQQPASSFTLSTTKRQPWSYLIFAALGLVLVMALFVFLGWQYFHSSLTFEAQIIYNLGGPQPVASQRFYLLDIDPFTLKKERDPTYRAKLENIKNKDEKTVTMLGRVVFIAFLECVERGKDFQGGELEKKALHTIEATKPAWEPHLVQTATTNFKGVGVFENLRPGTYWLMGVTETRAAFTFWSVKVKVGLGNNKVTLDQNNAVYSR